MTAHTNHQILKGSDGMPAFAVIPYKEYIAMIGEQEEPEVLIPHEVVVMTLIKGYSLIRAWREHLGLTQVEAAAKIEVSQPAFAQMEKSDSNRRATLEKVADAFGIQVEQLKKD